MHNTLQRYIVEHDQIPVDLPTMIGKGSCIFYFAVLPASQLIVHQSLVCSKHGIHKLCSPYSEPLLIVAGMYLSYTDILKLINFYIILNSRLVMWKISSKAKVYHL